MGIAYTEGRSLGTALLADLTTAILASTDWSRPNSGSRPTTFKATTTRGADMVFDLADAAINLQYLTMACYTSYDGTTLGTKTPGTRFLGMKGSNQGSTGANYYYWTVSASKEHIFIMIEGPRVADANPDNTQYGSQRNYFFMSDLVPYFAIGTDPLPAVVMGGLGVDTIFKVPQNQGFKAYVNQTSDGAIKWAQGWLMTLETPTNAYGPFAPNRLGLDGNLFMSPFVYFDDVQGMRGRLSSLFYLGPNQNIGDWMGQAVAPGQFITYNSIKYKVLAVNRGNANGNGVIAGPLGSWNNSSGLPNSFMSSLVAVPYSTAP